MKRTLVFLWLAAGRLPLAAQVNGTVSDVLEEQLELLTALQDAPPADDGWWQELDYYRRHPVPVNQADEAQLRALQLLSEQQLLAFFRYRRLLGKLVSLYELQAIPGWDLPTIRRLLPYIRLSDREQGEEKIARRFSGGAHQLLFRFSRSPRQADTAGDYRGSRSAVFFRYTYNYRNNLQWGISGDKDAGEPFFRGAQKAGFDFYSAHLFVRNAGPVKALALGDFTACLGQGLIHWQSLAFRKSGNVFSVKRQGPVLKPYSAAGEYNFLRGAGITLQKNRGQLTVFGSVRRLSASLYTDSATGNVQAGSLQVSGYHRTDAELESRNNWRLATAGGNLQFNGTGWHGGFNIVQHWFGHPFREPVQPYDRFAISGSHWGNASMDYSFTAGNLHGFGELALDRYGHPAWLNGCLFTPDPVIGFVFLHRRLSPQYQALQGNAFTENSLPSNESGWYTGVSIRPVPGWQLDAYADRFRFPWLRYRADAPGQGGDYLLQLIHRPQRQVEISSRYRYEVKPANDSSGRLATREVLPFTRRNWRTQVVYRLDREWTLRSRMELLWYHKPQGPVENGFSAFVEAQHRVGQRLNIDWRLHYFETDSYDTRMYAYEQSALYSFSIPAFYDSGIRYYCNLQYDLLPAAKGGKNRDLGMDLWIRIAGYMCKISQSDSGSVTVLQRQPLLQLQWMLKLR